MGSEAPLKYRLSLYTSDVDAILVKTWYRFEESAINVEERVCFMQRIEKKEIPAFLRGKRLDRVISVKGDSGTFTLPNSFNSIILKDTCFHDGGVSRRKGNIQTKRDKDKLLSVGTVSVHQQDEELLNMIKLLDVNQNIKDKIAANASSTVEVEINSPPTTSYSMEIEPITHDEILPDVPVKRHSKKRENSDRISNRKVSWT